MNIARFIVILLSGLYLVACSAEPHKTLTYSEGEARIYNQDAAAVLHVAEASLRAISYRPYDGNKNMIVGSRSIATPAAPFTMLAGDVAFPLLLLADAAASPFSSGGGPAALASVPIGLSGYEDRDISVRAVPVRIGTSRVTIWGHPDKDVALIRAALEKELGPSRPAGPDDPDPGPWQRDRG